MKWLLVGLIVGHGLVHLMGFAKAFGLAELPQLTEPITRGMGVMWLIACLALVGAGMLLPVAPRSWWVLGSLAVVLSQVAIATAWGDARFGTVVNAVILLAVAYAFASEGPLGLRAEYRSEVASRLEALTVGSVLTEANLASLPDPVQRYLRLTGAVGRPRPRHFRAEFRGRIRGTADDPWMEFTAEQHSFLDEPARYFLMSAKRGGLPVDVLHVFSAGSASMRVRLLSAIPLAQASGPDATRAETVTLLNDLCLFAPGALLDPAIRWDAVDEHTARAHYALGPNTVSAVLRFNDAGELVDFVSDDRLAASPDGSEFVLQRWSTPVGDYRSFGPQRAPGRGEGRWHPMEGAFAYIELEVLGLELGGGP